MFTKVNSELYGIIPITVIAGIKTSIGARLNKNLSAFCGVIFSLHNNLKASANVCKSPQYPTRLGPFLCVKKPRSFLSTRTRTKTTTNKAAAIIQKGII